MLAAFVIAFLALRLLDTSPNLYSLASPHQSVVEDNEFDDSLLYDADQEGIDRNDLEDQPDDDRPSNLDEYAMAGGDQEADISEEQSEPLDSDMPLMKEADRKEKRWIWSKKKEKKDSWVFKTGPTEGAQGTLLPEDEHVRNRAAEVYGNQYDRGMSQVSSNLG